MQKENYQTKKRWKRDEHHKRKKGEIQRRGNVK